VSFAFNQFHVLGLVGELKQFLAIANRNGFIGGAMQSEHWRSDLTNKDDEQN
jgi:hypothetical protein